MTALPILVAAETQLLTLVESLDAAALDRPTPCAGWDVRALLGHTLAGVEMFAAAADGAPGPSGEEMFGGGDLLGGDPGAAAERAVARSRAAWTGLPDPQATVTTLLGPLPAGQAMAISAFATAVHTWDLAVATGRPVTDLPDDVLAHAGTVAGSLVPALRGSGETADHTLFGPEVPAPDDATATEQLMAFLGRDPRRLRTAS